MWNFLKTRGIGLVFAAIALTALVIEPAWASFTVEMPGPAAGILAAGAVIGVVVIARWRRHK